MTPPAPVGHSHMASLLAGWLRSRTGDAVVDTAIAAVALNQRSFAATVGNQRDQIILPIVPTQCTNSGGHGTRDPIVLETKLAQTRQFTRLDGWDRADQFVVVHVQITKSFGVAQAGRNCASEHVFGEVNKFDDTIVKKTAG